MLRRLAWAALLAACCLTAVLAAQQRVTLSESYLPVAMQVIANLVDQMAFETKDEPAATSRPTARPTSAPTARPTSRPTARPTSPPTGRPTARPTSPPTGRPPVPSAPWKPQGGGGWSMSIGSSPQKPTSQPEQIVESTTPFHKPGLYAPERPPLPNERVFDKPHYVLLPLHNDAEEYSVIGPEERKDAGLLSPEEHGEVRPILEHEPSEEALLPPERYEPLAPQAGDDYAYSRSSESNLELGDDELNENNLQYVSEDLREMLKLAHDPADERAFDIEADGLGKAASTKPKLSQSNLRLLLLYDLLSREAKRQKLSDFGGFQESVMRETAGWGGGGARAQLAGALGRMLERGDCQHEYANNRAREMVAELGRDDSLLSSEIRYLQPLAYHLYS